MIHIQPTHLSMCLNVSGRMLECVTVLGQILPEPDQERRDVRGLPALIVISRIVSADLE